MDEHLVATEESAGAVIWRCSVNKVFLKIIQNSQENIKSEHSTGISLCIFWSF